MMPHVVGGPGYCNHCPYRPLISQETLTSVMKISAAIAGVSLIFGIGGVVLQAYVRTTRWTRCAHWIIVVATLVFMGAGSILAKAWQLATGQDERWLLWPSSGIVVNPTVNLHF